MKLRDRILRLLDQWPADAAIPTEVDVWRGLPGDVTLYKALTALKEAQDADLLVLQPCSAGLAVRITLAGRRAARGLASETDAGPGVAE